MMRLSCLPNQQKDEHVVLFLRRNWTVPAVIIIAFGMLTGIPALLAVFFWDRLEVWLAHPLLGPTIAVVASIYLFAIWLSAFLEFTDYYLDTWIVTNDRVLNTEQNGLFNRIASELHLTSIEDVTSEVKGLTRTFLDFGDVHIQTAAEKSRFVFESVDHPEQVKQTILKLMEAEKKRRGASLMASVVEGSKTLEET